MKNYSLLLSAIAILFITSCHKEGSNNNSDTQTGYNKGKNRFTIVVDGTEREYYVHVPSGYTGNTVVPVVFMLHGTSGTGLDMWERSGWRQVGEDENILTVYPSSLRYCIIDPVDGQKTTTKWNSQPTDWRFCASVTPKDDIKFLNAVLAEVSAKFKVDSKRVYLAGFSNGGQMAAKCTIYMSDKLAAIVENASSFYNDSTYIPLRKLPIMYQVGNEDYGPGNTGPTIPLSKLDTLIRTPGIPLLNGKHYRIASTHVKSFGLISNFAISGDTNSVSVATYKSLTAGSINDFRFVFVKGLGHAYPNGENHWMEGARVHWAWLKNYSLP